MTNEQLNNGIEFIKKMSLIHYGWDSLGEALIDLLENMKTKEEKCNEQTKV